MPRVSANEQAETRGRLIEAGKREFAQRGLAGARFDKISLAAGHAKGTIYNYFDSKEDLFFTIVGQWCLLLVEGYDLDADSSVVTALRQIAELDVAIAGKDPDLARVVVQHMPALDQSHRDEVEAALRPGLDLLEQILERAPERGQLAAGYTASTLARLFLGVLSACELEALSSTSDLRLDDVPGLIDRLFIAGMVNQ